MAIYMVGVGGFTSVDPEDEDKDQDEQVPTFDNSSRTPKILIPKIGRRGDAL